MEICDQTDEEDQSKSLNIHEDIVQSFIPSIHMSRSLSSPIQFYISDRTMCSKARCNFKGSRTISENNVRSLNDDNIVVDIPLMCQHRRLRSSVTSIEFTSPCNSSTDRLGQDLSKQMNTRKSAGDGWIE